MGKMPAMLSGSPPRVRGKGHQSRKARIMRGITPARAGKRTRATAWPSPTRDHPRVRGEKTHSCWARSAWAGSPPRARGKALAAHEPVPAPGITPACAGKRRRMYAARSRTRDHPRVRGEKPIMCYVKAQGEGSPPRARGKVCAKPRSIIGRGITPACAGKRWYLLCSTIPGGDHPRVRGEKCIHCLLKLSGQGSPPRARGKAAHDAEARPSTGITPACAGKSRRPANQFPPPRDHPRVRGEKGGVGSAPTPFWGSPPRARGKARDRRVLSMYQGITPACAGKRSEPTSRKPNKWDHPRVRGEKYASTIHWDMPVGSPPRARGKGQHR